MNELAIVNNALPIRSMDDLTNMGTLVQQMGDMLGCTSQAQGFAVATICHQKGLSILDFAQTYHIMNNRISKKTDAMIADLHKLGGSHIVLEHSKDLAKATFKFGKSEITASFSWEEAKEEPFIYRGGPTAQMAELKKPFEQRLLKDKYSTPRSRMQMLWARLVSDSVRVVCPQACQGVYTPEEVQDFDDSPAQQSTPVALDPVDAAQRVQAVVVDDVAVDYNRCPIELDDGNGGLYPANTFTWDQFTPQHLHSMCDMLAADDRVTMDHIHAVNKVKMKDVPTT